MSLPGRKTSPTIRTVVRRPPEANVYVDPTEVPVSVRKSVFATISRVPGELEYQRPLSSAIPLHAGSPPYAVTDTPCVSPGRLTPESVTERKCFVPGCAAIALDTA